MSSVVDPSLQRENLAEQFHLQKISTIAAIAGQLVYASMRISPHCDDCEEQEIAFPLTPELAAQIAEAVFNAAEARVLGTMPTLQRSTPERLRIIRLLEKLRTNTLDTDERSELLGRLEDGI